MPLEACTLNLGCEELWSWSWWSLAPLGACISLPTQGRPCFCSYLSINVLLQTDGTVGCGAAAKCIQGPTASFPAPLAFRVELSGFHLLQSLHSQPIHGILHGRTWTVLVHINSGRHTPGHGTQERLTSLRSTKQILEKLFKTHPATVFSRPNSAHDTDSTTVLPSRGKAIPVSDISQFCATVGFERLQAKWPSLSKGNEIAHVSAVPDTQCEHAKTSSWAWLAGGGPSTLLTTETFSFWQSLSKVPTLPRCHTTTYLKV